MKKETIFAIVCDTMMEIASDMTDNTEKYDIDAKKIAIQALYDAKEAILKGYTYDEYLEKIKKEVKDV